MFRKSRGNPRVLLLAAVCHLLTGCSFLYTYNVTVVVRDIRDGSPLENVNVDLTKNSSGRRDGQLPTATNGDGRLEFDWIVNDSAFFHATEIPLIVDLTKAGYVNESIDIGPLRKPTSDDPPRMIAVIYMRPTE